MGVPTSAVGYTAAMSGREDHEVHKDMWWGHWGEKMFVPAVTHTRADRKLILPKSEIILNIK